MDKYSKEFVKTEIVSECDSHLCNHSWYISKSVRSLKFKYVMLAIISMLYTSVLYPSDRNRLFTTHTENSIKYFKKFFAVESPEKGEFESDSAFALRLPKLETSKTFWFHVFGIVHSYDYPSQRLQVFVRKFEYQIDNKGNSSNFCLAETTEQEGNYTASNDFGVKTVVDVEQVRKYILVFANDDSNYSNLQKQVLTSHNPLYWHENHLTVDTVLNAKDAETFSKHITGVIQVQFLSYDDRDEQFQHTIPEINFPHETKTTIYTIKTRLLKVVLYDDRSKKIFKELVL